MADDYYNILGVSKDASKEEIKRAYKKLAKKYHPDISKEPDAAEKFKKINEAFSVLSDDQKRSQYDRFGSSEGFNAGGFGSDFGGGFDFGFEDIFDSIFGEGFFGGRKRKRGPGRGHDLKYELEISLDEAFNGAQKEILVPKHDVCEKCKGTGAESPSDIKVCSYCKGSGYVRSTRRTPFGVFTTTSECPKCHGTGKVIKRYCSLCDGTGKVFKNKKINISIPEGIEEGMQLRISGEGEAGDHGGPAGDLYVLIKIKPHDKFRREGHDLYTNAKISFAEAVFGGELKIDSFKGEVKIKIPPGTQPCTVFKVKGHGMPKLHGLGKGDLHVKVNVIVPEKLSRKQKELLKEFDNTLEKKPRFWGLFG
jgi:molecular chaperone DnaJ